MTKAPFRTERFDRYVEVIDQMLEQGDAYHCYCTRDELDAVREAQRVNNEKPRYNVKYRQGVNCSSN